MTETNAPRTVTEATIEAVASTARLARASDSLHAAVCRAVTLLNCAPEVARYAEGREARDILRQALIDYADSYMDEPATEAERNKIAKKHQRANG